MFSKRVENTVETEKFPVKRNLSFLPQCFQKTCTADMLKQELVWERVKFDTSLKPERKGLPKNESVEMVQKLIGSVNIGVLAIFIDCK